MANYPQPNIGNLTSFVAYVDTITSGYFMPFILLMTFIIATFAMLKYNIEKAMLSASFLTFVLAVLMRAGGFVADWVAVTCLILLAVLSLFTYISD